MECEHCCKPIEGRKGHARFCGPECAKKRHNVKMLRGAKVYDLLVTWRSSYKNRHLLTQINREVKAWIDEDAKR